MGLIPFSPLFSEPDPTGDHELSPSDVLFLIKYINSDSTVASFDRGSSGAGEAEGGWPTTPPAPQVPERAAPGASARSLGSPVMDLAPSCAASRAEAVPGSRSSPNCRSVTSQRRIATEDWLPMEEVMGEIADASEILLCLAIR